MSRRKYPQLYDLGEGLALNINPNGWCHGWLFERNEHGQYVPKKPLDLITDPYGSVEPTVDQRVG